MEFLLDINPIYIVGVLALTIFAPLIWGPDTEKYKLLSFITTFGFLFMLWVAFSSLQFSKHSRELIQKQEEKIQLLESNYDTSTKLNADLLKYCGANAVRT